MTDHSDAAPDFLGPRSQIVARYGHQAMVGSDVGGQYPQQGGLSGTVGAE